MKKKAFFLLPLVLAVGGVVFAGGRGDAAKNPPADTGYTGSLPFVRLKYYEPATRQPGTDRVIEEMNKIMRREINAELIVENLSAASGGQMEQKYQLVFASGEEFDSIFAASWRWYSPMANKNAFMELTPAMLEKNMPYTYRHIPQEGWNQVKIGGKIFMVPHTTREFNHYCIAIRGDLRNKYGLPGIKTYQDFENYMAAVKKNEPDLVPFALQGNTVVGEWIALWNLLHDRFAAGETDFQDYFVNPNDPAQKIVSFLEQPDAREFITMMNRWQKAGYWSRSVLSSTSSVTQDFRNGLSASATLNQGTLENEYQWDKDQNGGGYQVEIYDLTAAANKKVPSYPYNTGGIAINRTSKNAERVLMMVDLFRSDRERNNLAQRGIRGIHWDYQADGKTFRTDLPAIPPDLSYGGPITWGPFRTVEFQVPYTDRNSQWFRDIFDGSARRELTIPAAGFLFDNANFKTEEASVGEVYTQYAFPLIMGFTDPSELPNVVQRLKRAGNDKIIAEMQKQLDAMK
jgi:putative aldouronate transport system substrate-binding protein